jgi:hypothetical protein
MTAQCSSPVIKSIGGETDVLSGRINTCNTSFSVYPDAALPLIVAKSSLVTSNNCLVIYFKEGTSLWEIYECGSVNKEMYSEDG